MQGRITGTVVGGLVLSATCLLAVRPPPARTQPARHVAPAPGRQAAARPAGLPSTRGHITFDDFVVNTVISDQYAGLGVEFDETFIELDDYPDIRYLSGANEWDFAPAEPIVATFVGVTSFVEAEAIYLDLDAEMRVDVYDDAGVWITSTKGRGTLRVDAPGIKEAVFSFTRASGYDDVAGIDNLRFDPPPPFSVVFADRGQKYGWDDYTSRIPVKSLRAGTSDTVQATVRPPTAAPSCRFTVTAGDVLKVSPATAKVATPVLRLTGLAEGAAAAQAIDIPSAQAMGTLDVAVYDLAKRTVAVTLVHKKGTAPDDPGYRSRDIPTAVIRSALARVFSQAVVQWTVVRRSARTVAFDLNKDNKIDVGSWMSAEMQAVRDACRSDHEYNLFLVDNPSDGSLGFMAFNQKYGFIHVNAGADGWTVAHELGHGAAGLVHTTGDEMNLMYPYATFKGWYLRAGQWAQVNY